MGSAAETPTLSASHKMFSTFTNYFWEAITDSTSILASQIGFPLSLTSSVAISSRLSLTIAAALVRSRPLSIPESAAQAGKAFLATDTALSTSFGPELGIVHITFPVLGEMLAELPTLSIGLHRAPATQLKGPSEVVSMVMARQRLVWRRES